ncbi:MAG: diguanylate cyclase [Anaerotignum sp.]|nr:diguanylate cyclase [Anaerotignum sp.]
MEKKKILVVDDVVANLKYVAKTLEESYEVVCSKSGKKAIAYLEEKTVDLILLDIMMPEMDGFEVLSSLKVNPKTAAIPIIMLTAEQDKELELKGLSFGAQDFISKPFVPEIMMARVERILELFTLRKYLELELKTKEEQVRHMKSISSTDDLTGLWKRGYLRQQVNLALERDKCGCLFIIDIDNFKQINDSFGHIAGDTVLMNFAKKLKNNLEPDEQAARLGGDEFIIFKAGAHSHEKIRERAGAILQQLQNHEMEINPYGKFSISMGVALSKENEEDFDMLYSCADKALYYVKQNGKNSFHIFGII